MDTALLWPLGTALAYSLMGIGYKLNGNRPDTSQPLAGGVFGCGFLVSGFSSYFTQAHPPTVSIATLGIVSGVIALIAVLAIAEGSRYGPVAIVFAVSNLAVLIPTVAGYLVWGEPLSVIQMIGVSMVALAFVLLAPHSNEQAIRQSSRDLRRFYVLILVAWLGNGFSSVCQKAAAGSAEFNPIWFTLFFYAGGLVSVLVLHFRHSTIRWERQRLLMGMGIGLCSAIGMFLFMHSLTKLPSSLCFPIAGGGSVVLAAWWLAIFFKEPLTRRNWLGVAVALLALTTLTWR